MKRPRAFYGGLFATAFATLVLEVVDTRVLSVLTWYHLAFLAISLALLGMTAGAIYVYLRPERFTAERAPREIARFALRFAFSVPLSHLGVLAVRIPTELTADPMSVWTLMATGALLAAPFFLSGVVIALALTRVPLPVGRVYAADLAGAGLGCAGAIALLDRVDPTSGMFLLGALAAAAAAAFRHASGLGRTVPALAVAAVLLAAGLANRQLYPRLFWIGTMKGEPLPAPVVLDRWNSHSRVTGRAPAVNKPALWGPGAVPVAAEVDEGKVEQLPLRIDGGAFTVCTRFDGRPESLGWVRHDLTSLAFHLRGAGEVAVLGVGGGRDLLTAIGFGCRRATGIEINRAFLDLLAGDYREFAGLAGRPDVELVHDEGRAHLARTGRRFDLLQMALVDTWASTSAGAMTLTENGLYTVEAWRLFLDRLRPAGVLSVSRWYAPEDPGETARLLSLAVATLLDRGGGTAPRAHLALATAGRLSNLILARDPLAPEEIARLTQAGAAYGFGFLVLPGEPVADPLLAAIVAARTPEELARATAHPLLQLAAPTDESPFFFNMLRPRAWLDRDFSAERAGGVIEGNLRATDSLLSIGLAVALLAVSALVLPLAARGGGHGLPARDFAAAAGYFSLIGLGFMLVEIGLMQRFSSLLGHPIYSMVVTLMSLILATGLGALLSDALPERRALVAPLFLTPALLALPWVIAAAAGRAEGASLPARVLLVSALTVPVGLLLGTAFPLGVRLVRARSEAALPWMWGLNGVFGVLGSVAAVLVSMTFGIRWCLLLGALCYALLAAPVLALSRRPAGQGHARARAIISPG